MDAPVTTYADLDISNRTHYGRGEPIAVMDARRAMLTAGRNYSDLPDNSPDIADAWEAYLLLVDHYDIVYQLWMDGGLVEQHYNDVADAYERPDDVRRDLEAVQ